MAAPWRWAQCEIAKVFFSLYGLFALVGLAGSLQDHEVTRPRHLLTLCAELQSPLQVGSEFAAISEEQSAIRCYFHF